MKNITNLIRSAAFAILILLPAFSYATIHQLYDAKEKANQIITSIEESPIYGIVIYAVGSVLIFIVAIVVIFFLIMLLKR